MSVTIPGLPTLGGDVSSYQGTPSFNGYVNAEWKFILIRCHQRYGIDTSFEYNYKQAKTKGFAIGVYKFSYAKSVSEAEEEAAAVLAVLQGRTLDLPVYYDLEWESQQSLGKTEIQKIADAFLKKIKSAGYIPAIYCSSSWYDSYLKGTNYPFWIANYPYNYDTYKASLRPNRGEEVWQYGRYYISGVSGAVDVDAAAADYISKYKSATKDLTETASETVTVSGTDAAIALVTSIATAEIGYQEKASNSSLDSKTANAGYSNYTKYWRDEKPSYQGEPWCACFVTWCFCQAFGEVMSKKLLKHHPFVYCPTLAALTDNKTPKAGDIVLFWKGSEYGHTGIVIKVAKNGTITTIEGNTSPGDGTVVANGGGVYQKTYTKTQLNSANKYYRPDYSLVSDVTVSTQVTSSSNTYSKENSAVKITATLPVLKYSSKGVAVRMLQQCLGVTADGDFGAKTKTSLIAFQKNVFPKDSSQWDGICGEKTWIKICEHMTANSK